MSASFSSIVNDDLVLLSLLNSFFPKNSTQVSYDALTAASATVPSDALVVFCTPGAAQTLTLPSASQAGRDLIVVNRAAFAISSASSNVINIQDASIVGTALLPSGAGEWVHLVSNGVYWLAIAKNDKL